MDLGDSTAARLLAGGALCNDAIIEPDADDPHSYRVVGDPTEGALAVAAARVGMNKADLEEALPRVGEVPFSSERKRMTTVHEAPPKETRIPTVCSCCKRVRTLRWNCLVRRDKKSVYLLSPRAQPTACWTYPKVC